LKTELEKYNQQTLEMAEKAADDKKSRMLAAARMQIAKDYLAGKADILDKVFNKAKDQIKNMADNDYKTLVSKLLLNAVETGDEEVIVDQNEKRIDQQFISNINQKLDSKIKHELKLSDTKRNISAGFILKKGRILTNASLDMLIATARQQLEIELAKELFEGME
jgi:V/A-type H+-transporting ATPase subunit E